MTALTLWQPWATLIALGAKRIETRSWGTQYRGRIAIHAAKRKPSPDDWDVVSRLIDLGVDLPILANSYPLGCVVATAQLVDCYQIQPGERVQRIEFEAGNWATGRYAWELAGVHPLEPVIPAAGRQGLWLWDRAERTPLFEANV